ncbi:hypothetical protein PoB_007043100 [Plakobranchus ocellatus]|uniref:Uncharacterized protein n=1 Tax=Plakobranchus ocellatus TaxID=259542 RepID=A0AAV4DIF5_9GAST|nr:hypothetical protein PoB_007043100 [Plakobranchus ocellatus]
MSISSFKTASHTDEANNRVIVAYVENPEINNIQVLSRIRKTIPELPGKKHMRVQYALSEFIMNTIDPTSPQQGYLRLSGPPSGQGAGGGARTRDRRVPADLRADSLATVPPTPLPGRSDAATGERPNILATVFEEKPKKRPKIKKKSTMSVVQGKKVSSRSNVAVPQATQKRTFSTDNVRRKSMASAKEIARSKINKKDTKSDEHDDRDSEEQSVDDEPTQLVRMGALKAFVKKHVLESIKSKTKDVTRQRVRSKSPSLRRLKSPNSEVAVGVAILEMLAATNMDDILKEEDEALRESKNKAQARRRIEEESDWTGWKRDERSEEEDYFDTDKPHRDLDEASSRDKHTSKASSSQKRSARDDDMLGKHSPKSGMRGTKSSKAGSSSIASSSFSYKESDEFGADEFSDAESDLSRKRGRERETKHGARDPFKEMDSLSARGKARQATEYMTVDLTKPFPDKPDPSVALEQEAEAKNYFQSKGISDIFEANMDLYPQMFLYRLLLDKPANPLDYLIDLTRQTQKPIRIVAEINEAEKASSDAIHSLRRSKPSSGSGSGSVSEPRRSVASMPPVDC